ncbi:hypothetical protein [Tenacibaculum piscium]|uniref:hypothetical protein n=1 Tax=Tenacibaculum piscium TaxID=1458515 RepID=UPI001F2FD33E|nr:hypothetical protein [Tenacibaculum piscium]
MNKIVKILSLLLLFITIMSCSSNEDPTSKKINIPEDGTPNQDYKALRLHIDSIYTDIKSFEIPSKFPGLNEEKTKRVTELFSKYKEDIHKYADLILIPEKTTVTSSIYEYIYDKEVHSWENSSNNQINQFTIIDKTYLGYEFTYQNLNKEGSIVSKPLSGIFRIDDDVDFILYDGIKESQKMNWRYSKKKFFFVIYQGNKRFVVDIYKKGENAGRLTVYDKDIHPKASVEDYLWD